MRKIIVVVLLMMLVLALPVFAFEEELNDRLAPQENLEQHFIEARLPYGFGCYMTYGDGDGTEIVGTRSAEDINLQNIEPVFAKEIDLVRGIYEKNDCLIQQFKNLSLYRTGSDYIFIISGEQDAHKVELYDFVDAATGEVLARAYNAPKYRYYRLSSNYIYDLGNREIVVKSHMSLSEKVAARKSRIQSARASVYTNYDDVGPIPVNVNGNQGEILITHAVQTSGNANNATSSGYADFTICDWSGYY